MGTSCRMRLRRLCGVRGVAGLAWLGTCVPREAAEGGSPLGGTSRRRVVMCVDVRKEEVQRCTEQGTRQGW